MSIIVKKPFLIAGVAQTVGSKLTLSADEEARYIAAGVASEFTHRMAYDALTGFAPINAAFSDAHTFENFAQFWEGIRRGACTVLFMGDSTAENVSQNWPMAHWTVQMEECLARAFPSVSFTFINLSIGGRQARQVLGYGLTTTVPTTAPSTEYRSVTSGENNLTDFRRDSITGASGPLNPITWPGPASGESAWAANQTWISRVVNHNADMVFIGPFGLNEENASDPTTDPGPNNYFAQAVHSIIGCIRSHSTFSGVSRPSIACVTPYNDNVSRKKRDRLAQVMRDVARINGCPVVDGNKWEGVLVDGVDKTRQRWQGEAFARYLCASRSDGSISLTSEKWWYVAGTPQNSGAKTFIARTSATDTGVAALKCLRLRSARDFQISGRWTAPSTGTVTEAVCSFWYRVDPSNAAIGYEIRYTGTGDLTLYYHDGTNNNVVATATVKALASNSEPMRLVVRCVGGHHQVWIAFGNTQVAGGNASEMKKPIDVMHVGLTASGVTLSSQIYREGYAGFSLGSTGSAYPTLAHIDSIKQCFVIEFGTPMPVAASGLYAPADMQGRVNDIIINDDGTNPDSPGGGTLNHMVTDAYELVYGASIKQFVTQLVGSRRDCRVIGSSGVGVATTASTSEEILATIPVPAGWLAKNGILDIRCQFSFTGSTNAKTMKVRFGTTGTSSQSIMSVSTSAAGNVAGNYYTRIQNRGNPASQVYHVNGQVGTLASALGTSTVDTTVTQNLYITGQKGTAGEDLVLEAYHVELKGG